MEKRSIRECLIECVKFIEERNPGTNPDSVIGILLRQSKAAIKRAMKGPKAATKAAKASGKSGRPRIQDEKRAAIKAARGSGSAETVAKVHGVGADTVRRIWRE